MVKNIFSILRKNFQILLNLKISSAMLIFGPIILIFLIGFALQNTSIQNIKAGVYDGGAGAFSQKFIQKLSERSFQPLEEKTLQDCKQEVIDRTKDVCIVLSKTPLSEGYSKYKIKLFVDMSKQRTVWQIIGKLQGITAKESSTEKQTIANDLKKELNSISEKLNSEENKITTVISDLENLERLISTSSKEKDHALSLIERSQESIALTQETLVELQNSGVIPPEYSSDVYNSLNEINGINSDLQGISAALNSQEFSNVRTKISNLKDELYDARTTIRDMENNINKIRDFNVNSISEPVTLSYESITNSDSGTIKKDLGLIDYIFPSFLLFFILFATVIFSSINRYKERKSGAYIRNILSKAKGVEFILGEFFTNAILISIQVVIIIYIASFFLNLSVFQNLLSLSLILLASISIFNLIGIVIGNALNTQESIILGGVSISILFFIFSSIIVPVETLPNTFASIVSLLPLTLIESKLRAILFFGTNLKFNLEEGFSLLGSFIIAIGLTILFYIKNKNKEI